MVNEKKSLEFYFDSKTFTKEQLIHSIEEAKKDFPKKIIEPLEHIYYKLILKIRIII